MDQLQPKLLWGIFSRLCSIPRPSKHEEAVLLWIQQWAQQQGIHCEQDQAGNLKLSKSPRPGCEGKPGIILQGHVDMVPQKHQETQHDFTRDPINAFVDGEWVTAEGTTLGADNGIGVASALAILASGDIHHGPLEVLLTVDEEAGMNGAFGVQPGWLEGSLLINTDSEQEGEICMGCAGGVDALLSLPVEREPYASGHVALKVSISGLRGGHSGVDIHLERANANKIMVQLLASLTVPWQLVHVRGGSLRNALPRDAEAVIVLSPDDQVAAIEQLQAAMAQQDTQYEAVDTQMILSIDSTSAAPVLTAAGQQRVLDLLQSLPHGVYRMSQTVAGVPETSSNLGVVTLSDDYLDIQCLIRSLTNNGRDELARVHQAIARLSGARCQLDGAYPGWTPDPNSSLMALVKTCYQNRFQADPKVVVMHAGLECGLFKRHYPDWDMVSFGPTIRFPHSPDEKVNIASVQRYWELLVNVIESIPANQV
ncbi:cytosol nonspecific dipeptidase [Terasakiispira papahanaumokuakeensis]|uniref:Cytosol non-specific dipeptidase n=1 Tax=Terasakiispira papahanaumokuakeensis TaxID=197479 RepID=A0A1E2V821_9GAMM|nr:aminoacyl-histidine dipeptidase [Terasakiispira papahanaumokuakeensis]ODC03063.1 cytosol nonspecific dipeptidase [Terasakiispira papahanaumokuakeensis]